MCWLDVVAAFGTELGQQIALLTVPMGQTVQGMPDLLSGILTARETYDASLDMRELSHTYGVVATTLQGEVCDFVAATAQEHLDHGSDHSLLTRASAGTAARRAPGGRCVHPDPGRSRCRPQCTSAPSR